MRDHRKTNAYIVKTLKLLVVHVSRCAVCAVLDNVRELRGGEENVTDSIRVHLESSTKQAWNPDEYVNILVWTLQRTNSSVTRMFIELRKLARRAGVITP